MSDCKNEAKRRKRNDERLSLRIDNNTKAIRINDDELDELEEYIQAQQEEINGLTQRVTALENQEPESKEILTGFEMMKAHLTAELGLTFLNVIPQTEARARLDTKICRDELDRHYDNVDLPWSDSETRHWDAIGWVDPVTKEKKIVDIMRDIESLEPIVNKWQFVDVT